MTIQKWESVCEAGCVCVCVCLCVCVYLLLVAAAISLFQWSLKEIQADLVDGWLEEVVLHQAVNHRETKKSSP